MSWQNRTFRHSHHVEMEVQGQTLRFYPNRISVLHVLAELAKPVAAALATLFAERGTDTAMTEKDMRQEGTSIFERSFSGADPAVLKLRAEEREKAISALVGAVCDTRNRLLVGQLLMDSLREEFSSVNPSGAEVERFLYGDVEHPGLDLPMLVDLIRGWIQANRKVFGDAGEKIAAQVGARLGGAVEGAPKTETAGSSSKTESSPQSASASI